MKRTFFTIIILLVIGGVVAFGYFFRYRAGDNGEAPIIGELPPVDTSSGLNLPPSENEPPGGVFGETTPGAQPTFPANQKFGLIAQNEAKDYFIDKDNNVILIQPDGQIVKVSKGQAATLSSTPIANLISASFSYNGEKVLVSFGSHASPQFSVFDIKSKTWNPLDSKFQNPEWSPTDQKIVYFETGNSVKTLDLSKEKTLPTELLKINQQDLIPFWIDQNKILFSGKSSASSPTSLWSFDIKKKTLTMIVDEKPALGFTWNASGTTGLLFSGASSGRGGQLSLINADGKTNYRLSFLTLPSKCIFETKEITPTQKAGASTTPQTKPSSTDSVSQEFLYCAVPRDPRALSTVTLPDEYLKHALFTTDNFFKIDLLSGTSTVLFADQAQNLDADNVKIFNNRLFFTNRFDRKIYSISLTQQ